jgi:exportin-7
VIKVHPEILQQMLSTVLNIIMFEDCRNQWSMSRPLLGLILLNEEYFKQLRDQVRIRIQLLSFWKFFVGKIGDLN